MSLPVSTRVTSAQRERFRLAGVTVNTLTRWDILAIIADAVRSRSRCIIGNHNAHSLYLMGSEPQMRAFYNLTDYVNIDGMSVVFLGRLLGLPFRREHRTNYIDLLPLLAAEAAKRGWRLYYLGSKPGVAQRAAETLRHQYPSLQIATRSGYFDVASAANRDVLADIRDYSPDVLMIGMGMPRQEMWITDNLQHLSAHSILCCGGMMDLVANEIPTPPRWLGSLGVEWLYRLFSEPARLWRRYLVEPWVIVFRAAKSFLKTGSPDVTCP